MEITPRTLREVVFRERLRGYDEDDVDEFLERVATGVEIVQERLHHAVERADTAERRATELVEGDDAVRKTLTLAQRTAELAVQEARDEAARIVGEAEDQAREIVDSAHELARRHAVEAQEQLWLDLAELEAARQQLRDDSAAFERYLDGERNRLRLALGDALRWIDEGIPSLVPAPVVHEPSLPPDPRDPDAYRAARSQEAVGGEASAHDVAAAPDEVEADGSGEPSTDVAAAPDSASDDPYDRAGRP
ncbi:MAG TPA: DivIVA domain-containing protein [Acidimicrobiales bacterium]|nr:DivIVA domain-containing protein [Acidimicrobiales bacterium]